MAEIEIKHLSPPAQSRAGASSRATAKQKNPENAEKNKETSALPLARHAENTTIPPQQPE
jgi:hypothetical protein